MLPRNAMNQMMVLQRIDWLKSVSAISELLEAEKNTLASKLSEYPVIMSMPRGEPSLEPQIMAEISDISRFPHKSTLTQLLPELIQERINPAISKRSSPWLCKALFIIMDCLSKPHRKGPSYCFMDKKRLEGKPYLVYMTAGVNKFLRIYYYEQGKAYLASLPHVE